MNKVKLIITHEGGAHYTSRGLFPTTDGRKPVLVTVKHVYKGLSLRGLERYVRNSVYSKTYNLFHRDKIHLNRNCKMEIDYEKSTFAPVIMKQLPGYKGCLVGEDPIKCEKTVSSNPDALFEVAKVNGVWTVKKHTEPLKSAEQIKIALESVAGAKAGFKMVVLPESQSITLTWTKPLLTEDEAKMELFKKIVNGED